MKLQKLNGNLVLPLYEITIEYQGEEHSTFDMEYEVYEQKEKQLKDYKVTNVEELFFTPEEYKRESEITKLPHDAISFYEHYIKTGIALVTLEGETLPQNHPFRLIALNNTQEDNEQLAEVVSEVIVENINLQQTVIDLVARVEKLEKQLKGEK